MFESHTLMARLYASKLSNDRGRCVYGRPRAHDSRRMVWLVLAAAVLASCRRDRPETEVRSHPKELVGQWLRRIDSTFAPDTLDFRGDGAVAGVPPSQGAVGAYWYVKTQIGVALLCVGDAKEGACRTYEVNGDWLVLDEGPYGKTRFRRVRP
jgi:hypothetical protein